MDLTIDGTRAAKVVDFLREELELPIRPVLNKQEEPCWDFWYSKSQAHHVPNNSWVVSDKYGNVATLSEENFWRTHSE